MLKAYHDIDMYIRYVASYLMYEIADMKKNIKINWRQKSCEKISR